MQQPKQQRTYADLYSQQRSAASSPVPPTGDNPAVSGSSNGNNVTDGTAGAIALEKNKGLENTAAPHAAKLPPVGSSHKPSRIPTHPGQQASLASAAEGASSVAAAGSTRIPAAAGAAINSDHLAADSRSSKGRGKLDTSPEVACSSSRHRGSATPGDSSDWSQDSSTSFDASSASPAGASKANSIRLGSKGSASVHADSSDEQCCYTSSQPQQQEQEQALLQQQDHSTCQQLLHLNCQEQQEGQQQQQQDLLLQRSSKQEVDRHQQQQQQQQQQQGSHTNGGPGPPADSTAAAAAADGAAAAAGGCQQLEESAAPDSNSVRARMSADPDYELPQGKLTETQVLLAHGSKLQLDRYGFILGECDMAGRTAGAGAAAAAAKRQRSAAQVSREQRRVAKWRHMLGSSAADFEAYKAAKAAKVKRRVRKGIPDEFRGYVWQLLSGGHALMESHPGMYARLLAHSPSPVDLEIMRDLNRTFPNHVFFHQRQGPGQQSLFHVLRAYSAWDKQVGYVQGMGFVSAILLMYMSEEAAFWTLVALLKGTDNQPPLEGLYQAGMPLLQQSLFQFHELLKQEHPRLGLHLEQEGVVPSMYCTHWFNTLFAYSLPFEHLLRVWDVFLLEGMKVVFRVGITLLASTQDQLCVMPFERLVAALNGRKFPVLNKHPDVLMKGALRIPVSRQLEQLRGHFLALQAETQAAAAASGSQSAVLGAAAAADAGGAPLTHAATSGGHGRNSSSHSKSSAAHAQQQLIAGFAPVPMGPNR